MSEHLEQTSFHERLLTWSLGTVLWIGTHIFKLNRLAAIEMVPLESPIQDALELYGEPDEVSVHDRHQDARLYIFSVGVFHQAIVTEWNGLVHAVSYWSDRSAPYHDLKCIMKRYGKEMEWRVLSEGYTYIREDERCLLNCSAAPTIGVVTREFNQAARGAILATDSEAR